MFRRVKSQWIWVLCMVLLLVACGRAGAGAAEKLELAVKYLSENKFEEAVLAYQEVIKIEPKNPLGYKGLSVAFEMQGQQDKAEQALQSGIKQVTDSPTLQLALAALMLEVGKVDSAETMYKKIAGDGKNLPALKVYIQLLLGRHQPQEALEFLQEVLKNNEKSEQIYALMADIYRSTAQEEEMLQAVQRSLSLQPEQFASYHILKEFYQDRMDQLITLGQQYTEQGQKTAGLALQLTGLYETQRYEEVIQQYTQLENPDSTWATLLAARAYDKLDQRAKGLELLGKWLAKDLKDVDLVVQLAQTCLELGETQLASKAAEKGLALDNTVADLYVLLYQCMLPEDAAKANLWLTRYFLSSVLSVDDTADTLEKTLIQHDVKTDFLKEKSNKRRLDDVVIKYLQEARPQYVADNRRVLEAHRLENIYIIKYGNPARQSGSFDDEHDLIYLIYDLSTHKLAPLLDKKGEIFTDIYFTRIYNFGDGVFKDINGDGSPEWAIALDSGGSGGYGDCYVYNYQNSQLNLAFAGDGGNNIFQRIGKVGNEYRIQFLGYVPEDWSGPRATWPKYDIWYTWDGSKYVKHNNYKPTKPKESQPKELSILEAKGDRGCLIKRVYNGSDGTVYLDVDYMEIYLGWEQAYAEGKKDGDTDIQDPIYIRNSDESIDTLKLSPNASLYGCFMNDAMTGFVLRPVTIQDFLNDFPRERFGGYHIYTPFFLNISNGTITKIMQVYTP